ncbi:MAG: hypothetical protein IPQ13_10660 [Holophagaceae bacterium]|nr:hypothetical protein [Holophagaceae bacterium]
MAFPELSVQALAGSEYWWIREANPSVMRGSVVWVLVPFHTGMHVRLVVQRKPNEPNDHFAAKLITAEQYTLTSPDVPQDLPIAMLPSVEDGHYTLRVVKKRPALVLGLPGQDIPHNLVQGKPHSRTVPCIQVAPYYTVVKPGELPRYSAELLEMVQRLRFSQFFYEELPIPGGFPSILRFDQIQSVPAKERDFYEKTPWRLSGHAMAIIDEILETHLWGGIPEKGILATTVLPLLA